MLELTPFLDPVLAFLFFAVVILANMPARQDKKNEQSDFQLGRDTWQKLSRLRVKEARTLLRAGHYQGAYYLLGYAVECALKSCISKQVKRNTFPEKNSGKYYTHDLTTLLSYAGLASELSAQDTKTRDSWNTVKDWSEERRYRIDQVERVTADFYTACTARKFGVLAWIRKSW